ncbi:MAG TPA: FG-GAP-like repeat-containing protein, partial [Bacteroidota bacterium]|nr:FG-GAP-like repeat-containing protein [Bacteroidota bacterium]
TGDGFMRDETPVRMGGDSLRWTRAAAISDVDGDGDPDVLDVGFFVGGNNPQVKLLKNDGSGFFTEEHAGDIAGLSGWFNDAEFAPLSRDTLPDLYIARIIVGQDASDLLLLNRGDGSFRDSSGLLPPVLDFTVSASVSDFDRDGDIDIVVGNGNATQDLTGQNRLYINQRFSPPADVRDGDGIPRGTILRQNYPNPFNASTVIRYSLGTGASVSLTAVNVLGTVVMKSEPGYQPPGTYEFRWDAGGLPGGIYFYTLRVGGMRVSPRAAVLLK